MKNRYRHALGLTTTVLLAIGCATQPVSPAQSSMKAIQAQHEIPEDQLLDVGIQVFDPGLPPPSEAGLKKNENVFPEVRESESRYLPYHLKGTLEGTGQWGAVRVVPEGLTGSDVTVSARIVKSTGMELVLDVRAVDSSGTEWLEKRYKAEADVRAYLPEQPGQEITRPADPYQRLYNAVANDLLAARERLDPEATRDLREISQIRFAAQMAPTPFREYLEKDRKGEFKVTRLPSENDPMMERIARIRERDYMFVDTLNEHYANFYSKMEVPYEDWRAFSYEEELALKELRRAARMRKILGIAAMVGAVVADVDNTAGAIARDAALIGGMEALRSGIAKGKEAKIHRAALQELGQSFEAEVEPLVFEVEGQTLKLTGSAEAQFAEWRALLQDIWLHETGLPVDANTPADTGPTQ